MMNSVFGGLIVSVYICIVVVLDVFMPFIHNVSNIYFDLALMILPLIFTATTYNCHNYYFHFYLFYNYYGGVELQVTFYMYRVSHTQNVSLNFF